MIPLHQQCPWFSFNNKNTRIKTKTKQVNSVEPERVLGDRAEPLLQTFVCIYTNVCQRAGPIPLGDHHSATLPVLAGALEWRRRVGHPSKYYLSPTVLNIYDWLSTARIYLTRPRTWGSVQQGYWFVRKKMNFFICGPILMYDSSFCRFWFKRKVTQQFFRKKQYFNPRGAILSF